jgi:cytochrome P450 family 130
VAPTSDFVYDPTRPDFQAKAHAIYRVLRDEHPVYENPATGIWALSRYADVRDAATDTTRLSSENTDISVGLLPHIQSLDPPRHDALRNLVSRAFTGRRADAMEPRIRAIAKQLIDRFAARGEADLMADFSRHLPSLVIGEMIGVPEDRREAFLDWTEAMVETDVGKAHDVIQPATNIYGEFSKLLAERRVSRRADLMSALIDAEIEGEHLSEEELLGFCFTLIVAGNDTTTNLIANGLVLLAEHPEQRALLAREPVAIPNATEEMLRCESPAQALPRRVMSDVTLHGRTIPKGAMVRLVWAAANRDEREFSNADAFDVTRPAPRHLGFGVGTHFCLGARLARLEARVAFEELLARVPDYELTGDPGWKTSIWARSHHRVPVRFTPHTA